MSEPLDTLDGMKAGDTVKLVIGMVAKLRPISEVLTAYEVDGRWYRSDGVAVDGSLAYITPNLPQSE